MRSGRWRDRTSLMMAGRLTKADLCRIFTRMMKKVPCFMSCSPRGVAGSGTTRLNMMGPSRMAVREAQS